MAIPSLALIPTGYKDGKLYSVLPESGVGDFTAVRGSGATRVNKDGLVETMASNEPRLDYTDGGCPSLLLEPQSTNLITYSEDFSDASWVKNQTTITQNATISPSGLIDASMISEDNTNNFHRVRRAISPAANSTLSIFAKKGTNDKFLLWTGASGVGFDLTLGTINNVSGLNPSSGSSIKDFGNGWYRCSITDNSISAFEVFSLQDFSGFTYQGSSTNNFYIYGAQLEELPYSTSYIPTEGVIATRLEDLVTGAGDATTFNSTEGVLYVEMEKLSSVGDGIIGLFGNSASSQLRLEVVGSVIKAQLFNGSFQTNMSTTQVVTDNNKIAFKYKENDFALWINGVEVATDNSGVTFNADELIKFNLTAQDNISVPFYGKVKDLRVYNTALTDLELTELTTI